MLVGVAIVVVVATIVITVTRSSHGRVCSDGSGRGSIDSSGTNCSGATVASAATVTIEPVESSAAETKKQQ